MLELLALDGVYIKDTHLHTYIILKIAWPKPLVTYNLCSLDHSFVSILPSHIMISNRDIKRISSHCLNEVLNVKQSSVYNTFDFHQYSVYQTHLY